MNGQKLDWSGLLLEEKVPKADEVSWGQGKSQARTGRPRQQEGRGTLKEGRGTLKEGRGTLKEGRGTLKEGRGTPEDGTRGQDDGETRGKRKEDHRGRAGVVERGWSSEAETSISRTRGQGDKETGRQGEGVK